MLTTSSAPPAACVGDRAGRAPGVLADRHADPHAADRRTAGRRSVPGREVALLVEHRVVGQDALAVDAEHLARRRRPRRRCRGRGRASTKPTTAAHAPGARPRPCRAPRRLSATKPGLQQQVLGRVAGDRQLGEARRGRTPAASASLERVEDPRDVAVEVADDQVELAQRRRAGGACPQGTGRAAAHGTARLVGSDARAGRRCCRAVARAQRRPGRGARRTAVAPALDRRRSRARPRRPTRRPLAAALRRGGRRQPLAHPADARATPPHSTSWATSTRRPRRRRRRWRRRTRLARWKRLELPAHRGPRPARARRPARGDGRRAGRPGRRRARRGRAAGRRRRPRGHRHGQARRRASSTTRATSTCCSSATARRPARAPARAVMEIARRCFRIDANLRPEGRDGPLVRSIESYEAYWRPLGPAVGVPGAAQGRSPWPATPSSGASGRRRGQRSCCGAGASPPTTCARCGR